MVWSILFELCTVFIWTENPFNGDSPTPSYWRILFGISAVMIADTFEPLLFLCRVNVLGVSTADRACISLGPPRGAQGMGSPHCPTASPSSPV